MSQEESSAIEQENNTQDQELKEQAAGPQAPLQEEDSDEVVSGQTVALDAHLRLQADFDNFRKRNAKERIELIKTANEDLIVELLDVLDNLQRAVDSVPEERKSEDLFQGIVMVQKQFVDLLEKRGLKTVESKGKAFDAHIHDAVSSVPSSDVPEDHVLEELQVGYTLGDKVVRHAKVVVAQKKEDE